MSRPVSVPPSLTTPSYYHRAYYFSIPFFIPSPLTNLLRVMILIIICFQYDIIFRLIRSYRYFPRRKLMPDSGIIGHAHTLCFPTSNRLLLQSPLLRSKLVSMHARTGSLPLFTPPPPPSFMQRGRAAGHRAGRGAAGRAAAAAAAAGERAPRQGALPRQRAGRPASPAPVA